MRLGLRISAKMESENFNLWTFELFLKILFYWVRKIEKCPKIEIKSSSMMFYSNI
jgi:hypothetical protein